MTNLRNPVPELARTALLTLLAFVLLTGGVYPLVVTGIAQAVFPGRANGSLLERDGVVVGSALIGQRFTSPAYFRNRPSATSPFPYDAAASTGSNLGPTNPALVEAVKARVAALRAADPDNNAPIPADLVTASGSGLDPDISPAAAFWQADRVARARRLAPDVVRRLVRSHTEGRWLGIFGEPRVNVLQLNLSLDSLSASRERR